MLPIILHYTAIVSAEPPQKSNLEDKQTETVAPVSIAAVVGPLCIITTGTAAKPGVPRGSVIVEPSMPVADFPASGFAPPASVWVGCALVAYDAMLWADDPAAICG